MTTSIITLIVQGTLGLLAFASALAWSIVLLKAVQLHRSTREDRRFLRKWGHRAGLPPHKEVAAASGPLARLALAAVGSWDPGVGVAPAELEVHRDVLERSLVQRARRERRSLEGELAVLASIGTTAPFIGLFGTVFGIIDALGAIAANGSASLDVVAGPIGEALIATGVGIAVAVPAVLAYNYFGRRVKGIIADLDDYSSTLVNAALRASLSRASGQPSRGSDGESEEEAHDAAGAVGAVAQEART
jgi:biopolymer transport protein ExbB